MSEDDIVNLANTISKQEKEIKELKERATNYSKANDTYRKERDYWKEKYEEMLRKNMTSVATEMLQEAHKKIMAENTELHKRVDAVYAGKAIDNDAKRHVLIDILKRVNGIKESLDVALKEE